MEDFKHFNAGHGAALNTAGVHELDASIMRGSDLAAGAVTLVRHIRNPIKAARALLDGNGPVMLGGPDADKFAEAAGLEIVEQDYFTTERRVQALKNLKERGLSGTLKSASEAEKHGTVGAVALDADGHLAAATSTGGYNNKPEGRIGDTPIIGAGTYARDGVCAASGTGAGEFFIRHAVAHEIASRVAYLGETIAEAAGHVVHNDLKPHGVGAGVIAIDARGNVAAPYNTDGMFRGWIAPWHRPRRNPWRSPRRGALGTSWKSSQPISMTPTAKRLASARCNSVPSASGIPSSVRARRSNLRRPYAGARRSERTGQWPRPCRRRSGFAPDWRHGDRLAEIGVRNGWAGVVINGAIRDSLGIDALEIGVKALGATARRGWSSGSSARDVRLGFVGVTFVRGNWVYADVEC